jgi:uncharacterized protein YggE
MTETTISVQGNHSAWYPAERATVTIAVSFDGPSRQPVFRAASASLDAVRATVDGLHDASTGPITWWSANSVRVWSQRPWNNQGKQLEPVHTAAFELTAKFKDFEALASWIEAVVAIPGTNVRSIDWTLTEARQTSVLTEARSRAVKDAVSKATVYAQSIGLGSVTATAIADPGMLGDGASVAEQGFGKFGGMTRGQHQVGDGAPLALKPEDIEVTASVDARFIAR